MRRVSPLAIIALLLLQTMALGLSYPVSAGGSNDDFSVTGISVGNETFAGYEWIQPDASTLVYVTQGDSIEISMDIVRGGTAFSAKAANASIEIVHPIGFVMHVFKWTTADLIGGQSDTASFTYTAEDAHSILNTSTNELSGGLIIRAMVSYSGDDRNENDVMESNLPVAIMKNEFDGTQVGAQTFISGRYPASGGGATGTGSWDDDPSGAAVGASHFRHSAPGSNYPSNAYDRLMSGFFTGGNGDCGPRAQLDSDLSQYYGIWVCKNTFFAGEYISSQVHVQAWGSLEPGDNVAFEFWRGTGAYDDPLQSLHYNFTELNPSEFEDDWTNLSWDPQETWRHVDGLANPDLFLGGNSLYFGLLFSSNSGGASEGMHVDDWVHFGISKVDDYTLTLDCDNPVGGYSLPPNGLASLRCDVTNNGYTGSTVRVQTSVSNVSWMDPANPRLRIDVADVNDHDSNVLIPSIPGGATREVWVNLTVPPGADVQQQTWDVTFTDAGSKQTGLKGEIFMDVAVTEQYGVSLTSTTGLEALSLGPDQSGIVPFRLQNTGNRDAAFNLATTFSEAGWTAIVENETGVLVQNPIVLGKGEATLLNLNVTADDKAAPGSVSFNMRATCPSCGTSLFGNDVLVRNIEVPVFRVLEMTAEETDFTGAANGVAKTVYISIFNQGNDDEQYNVSIIQSNWLLGANLVATQTTVMDAWDGESSIILNLPMPVGLNPGLYSVRVIATNVDDPTIKEELLITVDILDTAAVWVSNEDADQSYIPGDPAQTMAFEVRNDGNKPDSFAMSLDLPDGMTAEFTNLVNGMTPEIDVGASFNVSVSFAFEKEANDGQYRMGVVATSNADGTVSATGEAVYQVGSQDWLRILDTPPLVIEESDEDYVMIVRVRNQYTSAQSVVMELDNGESSSWFQARINSNDRNFILAVGEDREVTIEIDISETTLLNLADDQVTTNLTIWARSETVSDAASSDLQVTMVKTETDGGPGTTTTGGEGEGFDFMGMLVWIGLIAILVAGGVVLRNILTVEEEEDDYGGWGEEGYEDSLSSTYGSVAAAPTVTAAGVVAEPAKTVPEVATTPVAPQPTASSAPAAGAPPLPEGGLPAGWSMEQWNAYGQQWLDQQ